MDQLAQAVEYMAELEDSIPADMLQKWRQIEREWEEAVLHQDESIRSPYEPDEIQGQCDLGG